MLQRNDVDMKAALITINRVKGPMFGTYPLKPDTVKLLRSYIKSRKDTSPYLFISNRGLPIDRRTFLVMMKNIQNTTIYSRFSTGTRDARAGLPLASYVPDELLNGLRRRLEMVRWPERSHPS